MANKEKRPAEMETPTGTCTMTFPDYNMFSGEEQEKAMNIMEIFWMALQINGLKNRSKKETGNLPTVFSGLRGHISLLETQVHVNGWEDGDVPENIGIYFNSKYQPFDRQFEYAKSRLAEILEGMKHDA